MKATIINPRPCGTVEQLKEIHRSPASYGSCAEPNMTAGKDAVLGCSAWDNCKWRGKHPSTASKPFVLDGKVGPANKGTSLLKKTSSGPAMRNEIMPCYDYVPMSISASLNDGVLDVIAEEGEQIELGGTIKVPMDLTKGISNEYWRDYEPGEHMVKVPPFPRISEQPKLKMVMKLEARRKQIESQDEENRRRSHLGMAQVNLEEQREREKASPDPEAIGAGGIGHEESSGGAEIHSDLGLPQEGTGAGDHDKPAGRKRPRYGAD